LTERRSPLTFGTVGLGGGKGAVPRGKKNEKKVARHRKKTAWTIKPKKKKKKKTARRVKRKRTKPNGGAYQPQRKGPESKSSGTTGFLKRHKAHISEKEKREGDIWGKPQREK